MCTTGSRLKVAVLAGKVLRQAQRKVYNQERLLFPLIKKELAAAGSVLRGVALVCAARGPGRFTGIRIALTLAGALKAMAGARILTATLFEILALQAAESRRFLRWSGGKKVRLVVLLHAFKEEYFCQFFAAGAGLPRPEGEPLWLKAEELRGKLAAIEAPFYAIADAEEAPGIYGLLPPGAAKAEPAISKVLPAYIIKASLACRNGTLKPLYLKPAKYELQNNVRPAAARG